MRTEAVRKGWHAPRHVGTSARLLRLLPLQQTPRDWSGAGLTDRLGVTPCTVRRDVDRLFGLDFEVRAPGALFPQVEALRDRPDRALGQSWPRTSRCSLPPAK